MARPAILWWTFAVLSVLVALISLRGLLAPLPQIMPHMAHYLPDLPLPLWAHLIGAPVALALAPVQLSTRLRARRPRLHRMTGYLYALAILAGGLGALAMLPGFQGSTWAATGFALLAVLWLATTATGILRARAGDTAGHRRMMLRSVALAFAAVTLRLIMPFLLAADWTVTQTYDVTAWASWLPNLLVVEWMIRRTRPPVPAAA